MIKVLLIKINWIATNQFGINLRLFFLSLFRIPIFLKDFIRFKSNFSQKIRIMPCLHDRFEESGATGSEYFWQDLIVARWIFESNPERHVDVGSRMDGFVAHVASFRNIEVFDVRPNSVKIPRVEFKQIDMMDLRSVKALIEENYCDSLSCLHTIEHFGLGRYGDPIDPLGYKKGIENMSLLLKKSGTFYLSTPIGRERVEFNANWVFNPLVIKKVCEEFGLKLIKLIILK
jgi:hypothetical protein